MLAEPVRIDGRELQVSVSVGVADFDFDADRDIDQLMAHADEAMYTAKRAGGDQHHISGFSVA